MLIMDGDTSGLGFQLAMYRWEDNMRLARAGRLRQADDEAARLIVAQYDDLVNRYNALAQEALKAGRIADARASAAEAQISSKNREIAELRQRLHKAEQEIELALDEMQEAGKSAKHYISRALAAEAELKELRSQNG